MLALGFSTQSRRGLPRGYLVALSRLGHDIPATGRVPCNKPNPALNLHPRPLPTHLSTPTQPIPASEAPLAHRPVQRRRLNQPNAASSQPAGTRTGRLHSAHSPARPWAPPSIRPRTGRQCTHVRTLRIALGSSNSLLVSSTTCSCQPLRQDQFLFGNRKAWIQTDKNTHQLRLSCHPTRSRPTTPPSKTGPPPAAQFPPTLQCLHSNIHSRLQQHLTRSPPSRRYKSASPRRGTGPSI